MNYKTTTITLTLSLTLSYFGLVLLYSSALADGLNTKTQSHGRNAAEHSNSIVNVNKDNPYIKSLQKEDWEAKLKQAELMLNLIKDQQQASN